MRIYQFFQVTRHNLRQTGNSKTSNSLISTSQKYRFSKVWIYWFFFAFIKTQKTSQSRKVSVCFFSFIFILNLWRIFQTVEPVLSWLYLHAYSDGFVYHAFTLTYLALKYLFICELVGYSYHWPWYCFCSSVRLLIRCLEYCFWLFFWSRDLFRGWLWVYWVFIRFRVDWFFWDFGSFLSFSFKDLLMITLAICPWAWIVSMMMDEN